MSKTLDDREVLKRGTTVSPCCGVNLETKNIQGIIRAFEEIEGTDVYDDLCPKCGRVYYTRK
tara:strand:- start:186 stop:371 length:186 start_codon:yes stop_codon:yes gene_type:complete